MTTKAAKGLEKTDPKDFILELPSIIFLKIVCLKNTFDGELISDFNVEWYRLTNNEQDDISKITKDISGIAPKKFNYEDEELLNTLIYSESTGDNIIRPSFSLNDDEDKATVTYSSEELLSIESLYQRTGMRVTIQNIVNDLSSNIFSKMNLNIEQNLFFQKTKTKKIDFKNTSEFEKQPEVVESDSQTNVAIATTSLTQGTY